MKNLAKKNREEEEEAKRNETEAHYRSNEEEREMQAPEKATENLSFYSSQSESREERNISNLCEILREAEAILWKLEKATCQWEK